MISRQTIIVSALMVLAGCSTMSKEECLVSDWQAIGFEDGARGYTADRIGQHRKACAGYGVAPDLAAYRRGRDEGLQHFCTPQNGFNLGSSGGAYGGICPADLAADFSSAYAEGRRLHDLRSRVNSADYQIATLKRQVSDLEHQIDANEQTIIASGTDNLERARLLLETKDLVDQRADAKDSIHDLERDRAAYQKDLDDYRETVAYNER
jgi:outer membrane murein-binding lipoprotein Lpp